MVRYPRRQRSRAKAVGLRAAVETANGCGRPVGPAAHYMQQARELSCWRCIREGGGDDADVQEVESLGYL